MIHKSLSLFKAPLLLLICCPINLFSDGNLLHQDNLNAITDAANGSYEMLSHLYAQTEIDEAKKCIEHNLAILSANRMALFQTPHIPKLGSLEKKRLYASFFAQEQSLSNKKLMSNLHVFDDAAESNNIALFNKINTTKTMAGAFTLQNLLAQPTTDIAALQNRQTMVKALLADEALFTQINALLEICKTNEDGLLWFWKGLDEASNRFFNLPYLPGNTSLNKNEMALELLHLFEVLLIPALITAGGAILAPWLLMVTVILLISPLAPLAILTGTAGLLAILMPMLSIVAAGNLGNASNQMHAQLHPVVLYTQALEQLTMLIAKNPPLSNALPHFKNTFLLNKQMPAEFKALIENLTSRTLTSDASFFSNRGRVMASFKMMYNCKDHFVDSLKLLGELDMCMSIAQLYKKQNTSNSPRYCFAEYSTENSPSLLAKNLWNPTLQAKYISTNSIELGGTQQPFNLISGQERAGKTSLLKGAALSVLLAQTLGIAPASRFVLTPFSSIKVQTQSEDPSVIKTEIHDLLTMVTELTTLPGNEKAFIVIDEPFRSMPDTTLATTTVSNIIHKLGSLNQSVGLISTQLKGLTHIDTFITRYQMLLFDSSGGQFKPYSLQPGFYGHASK